MGRPPQLQRSANHQPVSVKQLATNLPSGAFREVTWEKKLRSRFTAVRVESAHRNYDKAESRAEE